ncbi:hypothetical protein TNCV_646821 [Trichonephila clavipes]|nr:hypothetical protein TNCV_646821 [Trichonephila clavipes]
MKCLLYETPVPSIKDIITRISVPVERMRDIPGTFENLATTTLATLHSIVIPNRLCTHYTPCKFVRLVAYHPVHKTESKNPPVI